MNFNFPGVSPYVHDPELDTVDDERPTDYLRASLAEGLRQFNPAVRLAPFASVRLAGAEFDDGLFDKHAAEVLIGVQRELDAVVTKKEQKLVQVGVSRLDKGSVVMRIAPVEERLPGAVDAPPSLDIAAHSVLEAALKRVLDLHDAFENGDDATVWRDVQGDIALRIRQLVEALDVAHAELEVDFSDSAGVRRRSLLSERGRARAIQYFDREPDAVPDVVGGEVRTISASGMVELRGISDQSGKKQRRIIEVDEVPLRVAETLRLNEYIRFRVLRVEYSPAAGRTTKVKHIFQDVLQHEDVLGNGE